MGAGKATAGLGQQGLGGESATPPLPRPPPAAGHHSLGASSCLAGSPVGIAQQDFGRLLGQPQTAKPLQCPRPVKGRPRASKGMGGQGRLVRVGGVTKLPLLLVARPLHPRAAGLAQLPRRALLSPPPGPTLAGQWPTSPPPRWQRPALSAPALPPAPPTGVAMPSLCPSLGAAAPQWAPSPRPSHWWAAPAPPPGHLCSRTAYTTWARPPPAQAPTKAPPCQLRAPSPPPPTPSPLAAPLQPAFPPQAAPAAPPAGAEDPGPMQYLSCHQWGVHLLCTPWALPPPYISAFPIPHSWGKARLPCLSSIAQRRGYWGGGPPRPGASRSGPPSVGLWAGKEGRLAME